MLSANGLAASEDGCSAAHLNQVGAEVIKVDQGATRTQFFALAASNEPMTPERKKALDELAAIGRAEDAQNLARLEPLIARCGLLPGKMVETPFTDAFFHVILHANDAVMLKYIDLLRTAHRRGDIPDTSMELLERRVTKAQARRNSAANQ